MSQNQHTFDGMIYAQVSLHGEVSDLKYVRCLNMFSNMPVSKEEFLNLLDTCFPPTNKLHKILNRNTVKISYKCMPNMKQIISKHNKTILSKKQQHRK